MSTKIPPQDVQRALTALGVTEAEFEVISRVPFRRAQELLKDLKTKAHRNYKRLALELHPDRTQGDKSKAELFVLIGQVLAEIDKMEIHPSSKPLQVVRVPIASWQTTWNVSRSPNSTGFTQVQVIRVVNMRPK